MPKRTTKIDTVADLKPDPRNARRHSERNLGVIADLLEQVGAARSIVIDEEGVVLAGNGVLAAAGRAGIEKVRVVDADGKTLVAVRRTGLTAKQKAQLAVGDNRSNELSEWDLSALTGLADEVGLDFVEVGFEPEEFAKLGDALVEPVEPAPPTFGDVPEEDEEPVDKPPAEVPIGESFQVVIDCRDEQEQQAVFERMTAEGYACRVLTL